MSRPIEFPAKEPVRERGDSRRDWNLTSILMLLCLAIIAAPQLYRWFTTAPAGSLGDLKVSELAKRMVNERVEITGLVTNSGKHAWTMVKLEAEFFDAEDRFLDEETEYISADIPAGGKEHFKISTRSRSESALKDAARFTVRVVGGRNPGR